MWCHTNQTLGYGNAACNECNPFHPSDPLKILTRDCVTISVDAVIYWRTSHADRVICVVDNIK